MHGLDKRTDLSFLHGLRLEQLALGSYEFQLRFTSDIFISVQSTFSLSEINSQSFPFGCDPYRARELYVLLGQSIHSWTIGTASELILNFDNEWTMTIFDSNATFESYVIWSGQDFYAV